MKYQGTARFICFSLLLAACGAKPPVVYPAHLRPAGFWTNEKAAVQIVHLSIASTVDENGQPATKQSVGIGMGAVINKNGGVLTNHHVVEKTAPIDRQILPAVDIYMVCTVEKGKSDCVPADVLATDPANDLALLRAKRSFTQTIEFADDNTLMPGDAIYFWGNVFGFLPPSPFFGHYLGRIGPPYFTNPKGFSILLPLLAIDITVVNASSGAPLFNELGKCVGFTVAYFTEAASKSRPLGLVIPSSTAIKFLKQNAKLL